MTWSGIAGWLLAFSAGALAAAALLDRRARRHAVRQGWKFVGAAAAVALSSGIAPAFGLDLPFNLFTVASVWLLGVPGLAMVWAVYAVWV